MGNLEKMHRARARRNNIQKIILKTVATAGILSVALVAPNVLGALAKLGILPHLRQREVVQRARERLIKKDF